MVSIRRRRPLGIFCAGQKSASGETSLSVHGNMSPKDSNESASAHPLQLNDGCIPEQANQVATLVVVAASPKLSDPNTLKQDDHFRQFLVAEVEHRKPHRRRRAENRELCTMRGVYYKNRKWQAAIKVDKKQIHLGTVDSEEEAARLYDRAAFMCGREPNMKLSEEEKNELRKYKWEEFLALTRSTIANKRLRRNAKGCHQVEKANEKPRYIDFPGCEDDILMA